MDIYAVFLQVTINSFATEVHNPCALQLERHGNVVRWKVLDFYGYQILLEEEAYRFFRTGKVLMKRAEGGIFDLGKESHFNFKKEAGSLYLKYREGDLDKLFEIEV